MIMDTKSIITMKNILKYSTLITSLIVLLVLNSCKDVDPVIDELSYDRTFTPIGLEAEISNVTTVTLKWDAVKDVDHYVVKIYLGTDFNEANLMDSTDVTDPTRVYLLPAGDTQFSAKIKAVSSIEGIADSKWTYILFKSAKENLFTGYKVVMTGLGSLKISWTPGKEVTKINFSNHGDDLTFNITAQEALAGTKEITGLTNGLNEISLLNGTFVRGTQNYVLEGDVLLESGSDIRAAIDALSAGGVIILRNGGSYGFEGNYTVTKSFKLKGLHTDDLPVLYNITTTDVYHMFNIGSGLTTSDSLVFENLNISGYNDNTIGSVKLRGMFDQQLIPCNLGSVKFYNCVIRNFDRHVIRLRGDFAQVVNLVEMDNCVMYDYAYGTNVYGVINSSTTLGTINNIKITNSTIYHAKGALVNYQNGTSCQSVIISNCTINDICQDSSPRYIVDFNNNTATGTINISNCIFGSIGTISNPSGIRSNQMTLSITGCYYTSDLIENALNYTIKDKMTSYSGASTALWTDPANGIFTFLDAGFAGKTNTGDPRWR